MWGKIAPLAVGLICAACGEETTQAQYVSQQTSAQTEYNRILAEESNARTAAAPCYASAGQTTAWLAIQHKLWASGNHTASPPASILANKDKPTPAEVKALMSYSDSIAPCRQAVLAGLSRSHRLLFQAEADNLAALDSLMLQLENRKISWGEFAKANDQKNVKSRAIVTP